MGTGKSDGRRRTAPAARREVSLAFALLAAACVSRPHPPPLSADELERLAGARPTALRVEVRAADPEAVPIGAHAAPAEVVEDLRATGLFAKVAEAGQLESAADLRVLVHTDHLLPYHATPGHNLGVFLASAVVPVRWKETAGHRLTLAPVRPGDTGEAPAPVEVDTTWEGTQLLWGLAPFVNLAPDRSLLAPRKAEVARLKLALLPALAGAPAAPPAQRPLAPAAAVR